MKKNFSDIRHLDFVSLSEAKAKLSEMIRRTNSGRRVAITKDGQPGAVLISYQDFLWLVDQSDWKKVSSDAVGEAEAVIHLSDWEKDRPKREKVRESILSLFDMSQLSRKGQKKYKREKVNDLK